MTLSPMTLSIDRRALMAQLLDLTCDAGVVVFRHFTDGVTVSHKQDSSPVTEADAAGEAIILAGLAKIAGHIPVVAEEAASAGQIPDVDHAFFLVDPLDGTKEFIGGGTDFTVNIGLIEGGKPTLGVVYAPARNTLYWGDVPAGEAFSAHQPPGGRRGPAIPLKCRTPGAALTAVASKSHNTAATEAWLAEAGVTERISVGSSLKFVMVACGEADAYPRPAPTMEWDTAAGDAILRAAGGRVLDLDGDVLRYGKPRFFNPGFMASGDFDTACLRPFLEREAQA